MSMRRLASSAAVLVIALSTAVGVAACGEDSNEPNEIVGTAEQEGEDAIETAQDEIDDVGTDEANPTDTPEPGE